MKILKGILAESKGYYLNIKKKIEKKISHLPKGSIKEREISGKKYYYLQCRKGQRIMHKYLGRDKPEDLLQQIKHRKALKSELGKVKESIKIIQRSEGKRRG